MILSISQVAIKVLSPRLIELVLLCLLAWQIFVWVQVMVGVPEEADKLQVQAEKTTLVNIALLADNALFGKAEKMIATPVAKPAPKIIKVSKLSLKLIGVILAGKNSVAIISARSGGKQDLYGMNDVIQPGVVLSGINIESILVTYRGNREKIMLDGVQNLHGQKSLRLNSNRRLASETVAQLVKKPLIEAKSSNAEHLLSANKQAGYRSFGSVNLVKKDVDAALSNIPSLMTNASVQVQYQGKSMTGFLIDNIIPGSIFEKAGLINGDVIKKVNGNVLSGPTQAMSMYYSLRNSKSLNIDIVRAGQNKKIQFEIN